MYTTFLFPVSNVTLKVGIVLFCLLGIGCTSSYPDEVASSFKKLPETIDFNFHVRPILSDRCYHCHGPDENARKADLRLDDREAAVSALPESGVMPILPGKPLESALISRILAEDEEEVMPPPDSKLSLTPREKAILIKWIEQGANWKKHWAYIPPEKAPLPQIKNKSWAQNEIDYFVGKQLEAIGLKPSQRADKVTLIRRLSFDLTGLPPTPEEVNAFIEDKTDNAYEKLVERLLASPHFGERWAWEWLDVARYADTNGFQGDPTRTMWPWRDWVIQAFNANMPYDEFTLKQLAGDLFPNATQTDILATAFNRNHTFNGEGGRIPEETRVENVFDRVETVGTVWMGLTLNCSRCHDHKFDAISQKEYYQLFDYFNQTSEKGRGFSGRIPPVLDLSSEEQQQLVAQRKAYLQKIAAKVDRVELRKFPRPTGIPPANSPKAVKIAGGFNGGLDKPAFDRNAYQLILMYRHFVDKDPVYATLIQNLREARIKLDQQISQNLQIMVMDHLEETRPTYILTRGNYAAHEDEVSSNVPAILPGIPEGVSNDRFALANWLISEQHPLTARVTVNRYWQAFFGKGIVKTIEDFGVQGELPSHPELLDWMAVDFQENGWDLKALFKKIVMSATYQQSSKVNEKLREVDPDNTYLARATRMRLPSWMLRDQVLYVSGLMVDSLGGKPVKPYQPEGIWEEATFGKIKYEQDHGDDLYRRTLYTFWRRIVGPTMLFDNSPRQVCTVKDIRTNTPLHALTTLNDVTYMEAARVLAERILTDKESDKERLKYLFELATSRAPREEEYQILANRLEQLKKQYTQSPDDAQELIQIGEYPTNENLYIVDYAAFSVLGSLVFNLDETITRQ